MPRKPRLPVTEPAPAAIIPAIDTRLGEKLTKAQVEFNQLTNEINQLKAEMNDFERDVDQVRAKIAKDYIPIMVETGQKMREYAFALEAAHQSGYFKKAELKTLERHIHETAWEVIEVMEQMGKDDEELEALHDKYAPASVGELAREADEQQAAMFKGMFNIEVDVDKMKEDPEYFEEIQARLREQFEQGRTAPPLRKRTKKQQQQDALEKEAEQQEAKDARGIYTSLAKALHPDLERDEEEQIRKTEMMKRVTEAYTNNDFFGLLKLQLEYNLAHPEHLNGLAEAQLNRYISLLKKQKQEIEKQKEEMRRGPNGALFAQYFSWTGKLSPQKFGAQMRKARAGLAEAEKELAMAQHHDRLRERLKELKQAYKQSDNQGWYF